MAAMEFPFFISFFKLTEITYPQNHFLSSGRSKNRISFPKLTKRFSLRRSYSQCILPISRTNGNKFVSTIFFPFGGSMSLIFGCSFRGEEEEGGDFVNIETRDLSSTIARVEEDGSVTDIQDWEIYASHMRPVSFLIALAVAVWGAWTTLFS